MEKHANSAFCRSELPGFLGSDSEELCLEGISYASSSFSVIESETVSLNH